MRYPRWRIRRIPRGKTKLIVRKTGTVSRILNRIASTALISLILPVGMVPKQEYATLAKNEPEQPAHLVLKTDSPMIIVPAETVSQIIPGESVDQKIQRQKAEAEARRRAEAEAKARAEEEQKRKEALSRKVVTRERRVYNDPGNFDELYRRAQEKYGVDARLIKAVHYVETGGSGSTSRSNPSGATGPMQFMPSTFRKYAEDGNGDGVTDIHNVEDSVYAAAKYLKASGYPNVKSALWSYNPSQRYYGKVMEVATSLGYAQ